MISIIIPTYRRNEQLAECLASIRQNSVFDNEIIILHPFPDSEIENLASKYHATARLDNSRQEGKRVLSLWAVINFGINLAKSPYVCWLNDDCLVLNGWDKNALAYFQQSPQVGIVALKTKGIAGDQTFRTIKAFHDIECANYGVLDKRTGIRFDEQFSWFYGDADIAVQTRIIHKLQVVATNESCIIHNHLIDDNRNENESDPRALRDEKRFIKKWRKYALSNGEYVPRHIYILRKIGTKLNPFTSRVV